MVCPWCGGELNIVGMRRYCWPCGLKWGIFPLPAGMGEERLWTNSAGGAGIMWTAVPRGCLLVLEWVVRDG